MRILTIIENTLMYLILTLIVIVLAYGGWLVERDLNYNFGYEELVINTCKEQIRDQVRVQTKKYEDYDNRLNSLESIKLTN